MPETLSRRNFTRLLPLAVTAIALGRGLEIPPKFDLLENFALVLEPPVLPKKLQGLHLNAPFLHQESEPVQASGIAQAKEFGAHSLTLFLNQSFEPRLGHYHYSVLDQVAGLAYPKIVVLNDGYDIFHSNIYNPAYGRTAELSSPYALGDSLPAKLNFFTDTHLIEAYAQRITHIVNYLKGNDDIIAWVVGNEMHPPLDHLNNLPENERHQFYRHLTGWFAIMVEAIRELDPNRPVILGLADPHLIIEEDLLHFDQVATTQHYYPGSRVATVRHLPLFAHEIGHPYKTFGIPLPPEYVDRQLARLFSNYLNAFITLDQESHIAHTQLGGVAFWRVAGKNSLHRDNFELEPNQIPQTIKLVNQWLALLQNMETTS